MTGDRLPERCATCIIDHFRDYQDRFQCITRRAPAQFMDRRWAQVRDDTTERVNLYAHVVDRAESALRLLLADRITDEAVWVPARQAYAEGIAFWNDREIGETFFNSVSRRVLNTIGVNGRIEFVPAPPMPDAAPADAPEILTWPLSGPLELIVRQLLAAYGEIQMDAAAVDAVLPEIAARLQEHLDQAGGTAPLHIQMLRPVFYRGQGAYLIGRIVGDSQYTPFVLSLLHPSTGVVVDALLLDADRVSVLFSYTRSAFHVLVTQPSATIAFLKSILPAKPEAELFSAIGYFKHGKTVMYRDVCLHTAECTEDRFRISAGKPGMVMLVFDMPNMDMVVKLIRDHFDTPKKTTPAKVKAQYDFVFKHYRVGRLIEANAFEHLSFERCWFSDDLIGHLLDEAGRTVHLEGEQVVIDHAYLERRVTPLDIFLEETTGAPADDAVVDFGNAIKDLAMANVFPGDMLLKNFGVTRRGRVVFYDYDEILPLTDCRFRKIPQPRNEMEEMADEPWYTVAENDVFPEELSRFLGMAPHHRELFLEHHHDLLRVDFWTTLQQEIRSGIIRHIRPYAPRFQLNQGR